MSIFRNQFVWFEMNIFTPHSSILENWNSDCTDGIAKYSVFLFDTYT